MTDPDLHDPDLPHPRPRGRLGQWSDQVKALLLLSLLAVAGALSGLGTAGAEAERVRDGLSTGGLRAALAEAPAPVLQTDREQARPDLSGGDPPPPRALRPDAAMPTVAAPPIAADGVASADPFHHVQAGHAAHMPTGPPVGLSA